MSLGPPAQSGSLGMGRPKPPQAVLCWSLLFYALRSGISPIDGFL